MSLLKTQAKATMVVLGLAPWPAIGLYIFVLLLPKAPRKVEAVSLAFSSLAF
jgi:hypothetical protein